MTFDLNIHMQGKSGRLFTFFTMNLIGIPFTLYNTLTSSHVGGRHSPTLLFLMAPRRRTLSYKAAQAAAEAEEAVCDGA